MPRLQINTNATGTLDFAGDAAVWRVVADAGDMALDAIMETSVTAWWRVSVYSNLTSDTSSSSCQCLDTDEEGSVLPGCSFATVVTAAADLSTSCRVNTSTCPFAVDGSLVGCTTGLSLIYRSTFYGARLRASNIVVSDEDEVLLVLQETPPGTAYTLGEVRVSVAAASGKFPYGTVTALLPGVPTEGVIEPQGDVDEFTFLVPGGRAM